MGRSYLVSKMPFFFLFCILFIITCDDNISPRTYRIKKSQISNNTQPNIQKNNKINFSWDVPKSWIKTKENNFAIATYNFTDMNESVKVSITEFPGKAGGIKNNVNRWRKQLDLPIQSINQINEESSFYSNSMTEFSMHKIVNVKNQNSAFLCAILPLKQSKLERASPNTAPRQCPTCSGPVGFAETNSILYFLFKVLLEPYSEFSLITLNRFFFQNVI